MTDGTISYDYKVYRSGGKHKVKTESIDTFLNFLSQHILPDRFVRIRHYGILSPCNREKLRYVQLQLDVPPVPKERKKRSYIENTPDFTNTKGHLLSDNHVKTDIFTHNNCSAAEVQHLASYLLRRDEAYIVGLIFTAVKKLKPYGSNYSPLYYSLYIFRL